MISLGIRVGGLALSFAQTILTARLLGPAGYGTVATVLSAAQVLATVAVFGLGSMAVREVPAYKAVGEEAALSAFLRLSLISTFILSATLAALTIYAVIPALGNSPEFDEKLAVGGVLIFPLALLALLRGWAQGFGRVANSQIPGVVLRPGIMVMGLLAVMASGYTFTEHDYIVVAIAAGMTAAALSFALLWRSDLSVLPNPSQRPVIGKTSYAALPFLGLGLAAILQGELNTLLLAILSGPEETGLFQPAARIAPLLALPVQVAGVRYAPRVAELWRKKERARIVSITRTFTWTTSLISGAIGLAIALIGPWLMLAFGSEFSQTAPLLWVIAAAQFVNAAGGPLGIIFAMVGKTGTAVIGQLAGLVVNLGIGIVFIPTYGAFAAVLGMLAATITWNFLLVILMRKQLGLDPSIFGYFSTPREIAST